MQEQSIFCARGIRSYCWVLFSAEFSIITSEDDVFIFYLTKSIFFHGDVIRGIGEKGLGYSTKRIRFSVRSSSCLYLGLVSIEIYKIKNRVLMGIGRRFGGYELNGLSLRITSCNLRGTNLPKHARFQLVIDRWSLSSDLKF